MKKLIATRKVTGTIDSTYSGAVETAPASEASAGNITTVGINFTLTEAHDVVAGDWIFNGTDEVRKVQTIQPNGLYGTLSAEFTSDITASSFKIVRASLLNRVWAIDLDVTGTNVEINGVAYPQNRTRRYAVPSTMEATMDIQLEPLIVDTAGMGGSCNVFVQCFKPGD